MGLRQLAESDLSFILEDSATGFGWPITLTNPEGVQISLTGFSNDISQSIDPDTGMLVSGRTASVAFRISSINDAGFDIPVGIADASSLPWTCTFDDIIGDSFTFKIHQTNPDRGLGIVTCLLEDYT